MATSLKNLSNYNPEDIPDASDMSFAVIVSEWNPEVTRSLLSGALSTLEKQGVKRASIDVRWVPGSFEIPLAAQLMAETGIYDAIICLGCVIQGETRHFDFICQGVTQGIMDLNLDYSLPFIFGILTTGDQQQALDRSGGKHGNKGDEAAITAIKMAALSREIVRAGS